jgi:hypothetical protein
MFARRLRFVSCICIALMGSGCIRGPLNPPRLVMTSDSDMTIQLFMQATILLANYYGYNTIRYTEIRERASRSGLNMIPFMPPETVRATPELVGFFNTYENNGPALNGILQSNGGYKTLVKYYIRTGLRASQAVCRNYLLNIEERNEYLEFLQKEIGVAAAVSTAVLALVNANSTLTTSFLIARTGVDGGIDAYQEYRYLNIDREAARNLVEAAQNALAEHYLRQVDAASLNSNLVAGGYTFSDALHAVSMIEYQCTRTGIRSLLTRSINNTPSNLAVDERTGTFVFRSTTDGSVIKDTPVIADPPIQKVIIPPPPREVIVTPPPKQGNVVTPPADTGPGPAADALPCGVKPLDEAAGSLLAFLCPTNKGINGANRTELEKLRPDLKGKILTVLTEDTPAQKLVRADLKKRFDDAGLGKKP